jgi:iron complex transport system ATP-binding protein
VLYQLTEVQLSYGKVGALQGISLSFDVSEFVAIAGPNGAGKSTLLGVMSGLRTGYKGSCVFDRREVSSWPRARFAQRVSVVPQSVRIEFPFTVEQVVTMGRTPFGNSLFESDDDARHVEHAMALTEIIAFRHRRFQTLSGGEKQRVILAAALAQTPDALLLDEPTTYLDLQHQIGLYNLLRDLARGGRLVITVTHDLNLASTFADRVIVLKDGVCVGDGTPADVFRTELLAEVFKVQAVTQTSPAGRPWIIYGA